MSDYRQQQEQDDAYQALERISKGIGSSEDAATLNIDPQALKVFYEWSEQHAE